MKADVDLVMMSKAATPELAAMTQHAIVSAKYGALPHIVDVVVVEQTEHRYTNAQTIYAPGPFNYNASANRGAKEGHAPWICFANNDLVFADGWLQPLLAANNPVVSPISPTYHRQQYVLANESGWEVGRHLSGWCYMMARWLWHRIGGLDETYPFWCADNAVMHQLRAAGVKPVLVPTAVVRHDVSSTLRTESVETQDDLTWALLHEYNQDRGETHLMDDRRYIAWKKRRGIA